MKVRARRLTLRLNVTGSVLHYSVKGGGTRFYTSFLSQPISVTRSRKCRKVGSYKSNVNASRKMSYKS